MFPIFYSQGVCVWGGCSDGEPALLEVCSTATSACITWALSPLSLSMGIGVGRACACLPPYPALYALCCDLMTGRNESSSAWMSSAHPLVPIFPYTLTSLPPFSRHFMRAPSWLALERYKMKSGAVKVPVCIPCMQIAGCTLSACMPPCTILCHEFSNGFGLGCYHTRVTFTGCQCIEL